MFDREFWIAFGGNMNAVAFHIGTFALTHSRFSLMLIPVNFGIAMWILFTEEEKINNDY